MYDRINVVIADDEPITLMNLRELFQENGYRVSGVANDGFDAIDICRKERPVVAIIDIQMPVFDGISAAQIIIEEKLSNCVILLSAHTEDSYVEKAKQAGVMGYILKPFSEKALLTTVEIAISKSHEIQKIQEKIVKLEKDAIKQKTIQQAKTYLSKIHNISEQEAYDKMRKLSMDKRSTVEEIAFIVICQDKSREKLEAAKAVLMKQYNLKDIDAYKKIKSLSKKNQISMEKAIDYILRYND